jgi:hypothetical protein
LTNFNDYRLSVEEGRQVKEEITRIVKEHAPITVRGVYYQCVLSQKLPFLSKDSAGSKRNYVLVQARLKQLRKNGVIAWGDVIDPSRSNYVRHRWPGLEQFAQDVPFFYRQDVWANSSIRPLVLLEKEGQIPVYEQHAAEYGVDVWACKGYSSMSHMRAMAEHIRSLQQDVAVLVCADWDPSGCDWPRAAEKEIKSHLIDSDHHVAFRRILVTESDLDSLRESVALRIPNPNDPRTENWLIKNGYSQDEEIVVEMDAFAPNDARLRMQEIYEGLRRQDDPDWQLSKDSALLAQQRARISEVLSALQG